MPWFSFQQNSPSNRLQCACQKLATVAVFCMASIGAVFCLFYLTKMAEQHSLANSGQSTNCQSAKEALKSVTITSQGVPRIIHQIFYSTKLPKQYTRLMSRCRYLNQDFVFLFWTDNDFLHFLNTSRPEWMGIFKNYKVGVEKADAMRLMLLTHFGGVYMDIDVECREPMSNYLARTKATCIIDQENNMQTQLIWYTQRIYMNSVMIATPGHPFMNMLVESLPSALSKVGVLHRTGPFFITTNYEKYKRRKYLQPREQVFIAPYWHFSPLADLTLVGRFNRFCEDPIKIHVEACKKWIAQGRMPSLTAIRKAGKSTLIHRFLHLGYIKNKRNNLLAASDVCDLNIGISRYALTD